MQEGVSSLYNKEDKDMCKQMLFKPSGKDVLLSVDELLRDDCSEQDQQEFFHYLDEQNGYRDYENQQYDDLVLDEDEDY